LRKRSVVLTVVNPRPAVEELLHLVNLATIIPITQKKNSIRSVA